MIQKLINQLHKKLANLKGQKIAFVLEGRDASGKGGFVKLLINFDIPFIYRHQGMPTQTRMKKVESSGAPNGDYLGTTWPVTGEFPDYLALLST